MLPRYSDVVLTTSDESVVVVIPWGGQRSDLLSAQVRRLVRQDIERRLEIRVAVNDLGAIGVAQGLVGLSLPLRPIAVVNASGRSGPAHARNSGVVAAPAGLLLFCDADDEAEEGWARHLVEALESGFDVVGGRPDYSTLNATPFAISRTEGLPTAFDHLPFSPSANLGVRGAAFALVGGFDESLSSGEDIDLCWRIQYCGGTIGYVSGAVLNYRLRQGVRELFRQGRSYGSTDVQLYMKHRPLGFRRSPRATPGEIARLAVLAAAAPLGRRHRLKLALKVGTVVGHVEASIRHRVYFL